MRISLHRLGCLALAAALFHTPISRAETPKAPEQAANQPASDAEPVIVKISLAEFEKLRTEPDTVVLDVRTPKEFAAGHVPGAVNIDWHSRQFAEKVEKLDKSKKYLVHCQAGTRSAAATRKMGTLGFAHLFDFSGGWAAYAKAGKPVEK
ncbi:MAG TPA: rhodanese-like domain-containing protein [Tepidisphaeraceae bacterium]|jgi:rhodanese-related sulfurtransferase|nr:rhodanese-like domain-containing protein [Tepidisphaeraceae bacterium]